MKLGSLLWPAVALALSPLPSARVVPHPQDVDGAGRVVYRLEVKEGREAEAADLLQRQLMYLRANHSGVSSSVYARWGTTPGSRSGPWSSRTTGR
jgi:hypothetical protein